MFEELKKNLLSSRKNGHTIKKNLLSTLIGECSKDNKSPSDEQVITTIKSFLKKNKQLQEDCKKVDNMNCLTTALIEEEILVSFMPKQLDEQEIRDIIATRIDNGDNNLGVIMKFFKTHYEGLYDGAIVSRITKELLSGN